MEKKKKRTLRAHTKFKKLSPALIYTTFKDKNEAEQICLGLLNKKLIVCANISKHLAIYNWGNKTHKHVEYNALLKTDSKLFKKIESYFKKNHSYSTPSLQLIKITKTNEAYNKWALNCLK
jgi:periplasmic divalent cation tolerance protein